VKLVPPIALFSGGVLMAFAAMVVMALWIDASSRSNILLPQPPPKAFASSLTEATSLEGIRQTCASVAQIYDTQVQIIRGQSAHISQLFKILSWGVVGVGFIVGPIFLYIYFATRKHVSPRVRESSAL
jgi:hypothetical protein